MKVSVTQFMRVFVVAACIAVSSPVHALLIDVIGDTTDLRIFDGSPGDALSDIGQVGTFANVDDFLIFAAVGQSKPAIGSESVPEIELSSIEVNGGAGSIRLVVYDDGFSALGKPYWDLTLDGGIFSLFSSTQGASISVKAYIDTDNSYIGNGIDDSELLASLEGTGWLFSESTSGFSGELTGPYGLAIVADITHSGPLQVSAFQTALRDPPQPTQAVPEPAIFIMMGLGLAGFGFVRRRPIRHNPGGNKI